MSELNSFDSSTRLVEYIRTSLTIHRLIRTVRRPILFSGFLAKGGLANYLVRQMRMKSLAASPPFPKNFEPKNMERLKTPIHHHFRLRQCKQSPLLLKLLLVAVDQKCKKDEVKCIDRQSSRSRHQQWESERRIDP